MRENKDGAVTVAIMWKQAPGRGHIKVRNGALKNVVLAGQTSGEVDKDFSFSCDSPCRLETTIENANLSPGANPTSASILTAENPFSFFLRDVKAAWPIFIPAYGVVVTTADDRRSYEQIAADVTGRGLRTGIRQIESEPEETYEQAAECVRQMQSCPTLLGIGRDARVFLVALREGSEWHDWVEPWAGRRPLKLPELGDTPVKYRFHLGRGVGAVHAVSRRLEDGVLPILLGRVEDGDVVYDTTTFVTLDSQELTAENIEGSDFLIGTSMLENEKLENQREEAFKKEQSRQEQTLLCCRVDAVNTGSVPRYAFFHGAVPGPKTTWDAPTGFAQLTSGQVCCVTRLNGEPCPQKEMSVLVGPGEKAIFEFYIPHRPVAPARAEAIAKLDFDRLLSQCRAYWRKKLESAAKIRLPEQRISEMVQAGLLHLDLHIYGQQPDGTLSPQIGPLYCPIGTESSPIIQFLDSMGYADVAGRSLQFFLDLQHEDGMIQNFQRYTVETGAALWAMGEHYRYTRDEKWVRDIAPKLIKSCQFLIEWRKRNQSPRFRGKGYGLIDGKCADPEDLYHSFMLNGYAYLGIKRVAEMLAGIDAEQSKRLAEVASTWREDIRVAMSEAMARSPVIPLGDGTWCPTAPPWPEHIGPVALHEQAGDWWTHGCFTCRDSMLGPLYLVFQEVIDPHEPMAEFLLNSNHELFTTRNVAFSQPYYSRHPFLHLVRGETKAFLKAYYNSFLSLIDRQTCSFWEHHMTACPHKTHEEAWFLMQTRWMLYMEDGETLKLLRGIPRRWLANGERIELENVVSYFGPISLCVESKLGDGQIQARVECRSDRQPARVELRLPHPQCKKPRQVRGGAYDAETETVKIDGFRDTAKVTLEF